MASSDPAEHLRQWDISAHMGGLSYRLGRRINWDPAAQKIIALPGEDLDAVLLANK